MKACIGIISSTGLVLALTVVNSCSSMQQGPNGGTIVSLKNSNAKAEILANAESGMIIVYTWDLALKKSRAISYKPLTIGSGEETVNLLPYPTADDSAGSCSRFFGKADWLRGGNVSYGRLGGGMEQIAHNFNWNKGLSAGKNLSSLFKKMDGNQGGMMGDGSGGMMEKESGVVADKAVSTMMEQQ
jgi:hypothetical protein